MTAEARILIVEDEPGTATLQRRRLERAGFAVDVAADVDAALAALARRAIHLVVIDYRLGGTTGLDLTRRMKSAGFEVPVILVSGSLEEATVIEAMRSGVKDVLVKSLDYLDRLPETVRGVLRQSAELPGRRPGVNPGGRILIVEDDAGVALLERRQLQRAGYEVDVAATPDEAMATLRRGNINLALLDLNLDGASGLDLYDRMKEERSGVPAVLVTAFADQAVAIRALRAGLRDLVPKSPDYLEQLASTVDRIFEQVRVERKLAESELRLASIVGTAMDAIVMCDESLRVVLFNRSAEAMFGCAAADALGRPLVAFIPALDLLQAAPAAADSGSLQQRLEVEAMRPAGDRVPIEVSVSDVLVHGDRLFTVIARDISERRRTEVELREADRRKDVFLGMLAHELRNPLAAITTAGEVLHRTLDVPGASRLTSVIRRQSATLARMVDDLLDVSRVTLGKIQLKDEPVLLTEVLARAADGVRETAASVGLSLKVDLAAGPIWVMGDATRLEQVFANLLQNATKFTPPGGGIAVQVLAEAGEAEVRVRDTGLGIVPALLPKVFDLFVQGDTSLDRSRSGLGIGLALVKQLVTMHGGRVTAHSAGAGQGSEFVVRLPLSMQEAATERRPETPVWSADAVNVLVVDDQPDLADCIALLVDALGHRARAVYGGAEALAAGRAEVPDLMLVDIGMPGMTGYDLARQVRRDPSLSKVQLVALTGYGRDEDRARVLEAGFDQHVTKPVADACLRDLLDGVAAARRRGN